MCLPNTGCPLNCISLSYPTRPALYPHRPPSACPMHQTCPTFGPLHLPTPSDDLSPNTPMDNPLLTVIQVHLMVSCSGGAFPNPKQLPATPPSVFFRRFKTTEIFWIASMHTCMRTHTHIHYLVNAHLSTTIPKRQKSAETKSMQRFFID